MAVIRQTVFTFESLNRVLVGYFSARLSKVNGSIGGFELLE